jgi:Mrp family chromosome partitioning ATPase
VVWLHDLRQATRQLAEKLLINTAADGSSPRVIAVVGGRAGHGASTVACATATLLAERTLNDAPSGDADSAVLLIDADLHAPSLHRQLGVDLSPGLTDWIADPGGVQAAIEHVMHATPVEGLTVMPAGALRGGALTPSRLKRLIDVVAANYRYVVIDLPPLDESPEAARLAAVCDGAILVLETDRVRKQVAIHTLSTLSEASAHVLGVVLNKRRFPVPDWVYRRV